MDDVGEEDPGAKLLAAVRAWDELVETVADVFADDPAVAERLRELREETAGLRAAAGEGPSFAP